ncbi:MAG: hypothetical protein OXT09_18775, partial [Myxococcales bacterium]|nr:hypothetical protein [Myxococcales bacterium]
ERGGCAVGLARVGVGAGGCGDGELGDEGEGDEGAGCLSSAQLHAEGHREAELVALLLPFVDVLLIETCARS